jgi:hypothetical protein
VRVVLVLTIPRPPRCSPGALQKIPTPRFELAVAYAGTKYPRQRATGSTLPKSQVTESGIAAATPLPEPGLQMTSGALFCHHEQVRGCGHSSPLSSQWAAVPTRRDDAICHMSTLSAESPPSISALHPNAVDRALAGRALSGHPGGSYPLDRVRPTSKADIRLIFLLALSHSLTLSLLAQLSSAPLTFTFLTKSGSNIHRMPSRWVTSPVPLSQDKASAKHSAWLVVD